MVEIDPVNPLETVGIETNFRSDLIKQEQSPYELVLESELSFVKCEEIEVKNEIDVLISEADSFDYNDYSCDQSIFYEMSVLLRTST